VKGIIEAIVIGSSAGAVEALTKLFALLPGTFPVPIIVVVHLPPDRDSLLPELFRTKTQLQVREAEDKQPIEGGTIYFAPPDYHLLFEVDRRFSLSSEEPVHFSRPSIDVLFESASDAFDDGVVGVVLTGANQDGAAGLRRIAEVGGVAIVQEPSEAFAPAMPQAAIAACSSAHCLPLDGIAILLQNLALHQ
jgi:two-component system, chemotaxis family, protein-glutamate methylesterase/glutaminase